MLNLWVRVLVVVVVVVVVVVAVAAHHMIRSDHLAHLMPSD